MRLFDGHAVITTIESVFSNRTSAYAVFENRPFHGFVFKTTGISHYFFQQKRVDLEKHELMFLPKHSQYTIRSDVEGDYQVINFDLLHPPRATEPTKVTFRDPAAIARLVQQVHDEWVLKSEASRLIAKSLLYQLLAQITLQQEAAYISPVAKEKIADATDYLRKHLYDSDLRVSDLYKLLNISDTYFGKLFRQVYRMTPIQYINRERIEQAKSLLASGDFRTVEQVAHAVGYSDLFYFSKVFKSVTGKTPSTWRSDAALTDGTDRTEGE